MTLSDLARATARRLGIDERTVCRARAQCFSSYETPQALVAMTSIDGRQVRMDCRLDQPSHVMAIRLG